MNHVDIQGHFVTMVLVTTSLSLLSAHKPLHHPSTKMTKGFGNGIALIMACDPFRVQFSTQH